MVHKWALHWSSVALTDYRDVSLEVRGFGMSDFGIQASTPCILIAFCGVLSCCDVGVPCNEIYLVVMSAKS